VGSIGRRDSDRFSLGKLAARVERHVPGQVGDLTGTQASLDREANNHTITEWVSGRTGVGEELGQLAVVEDFACLPTI
jgi:hypothetical protein